MFGSRELDLQLKIIYTNIINMLVLEQIKTNNPMFDAITTTFILSFVAYIFQFINTQIAPYANLFYIKKIILFDYNEWLKYKNIVEYEGKISCSLNHYDRNLNQSNIFSDRFKAICSYIVDNTETNNSINNIKEYSFCNPSTYRENSRDCGVYMVIQSNKFLISKEPEIYAYSNIYSDNNHQDDDNKKQDNNKKSKNKIDKIVIQLFSYKHNVNDIKQFVEKITNKYISSIEELRSNKKFIYTLIKTNYEESIYELWQECCFSSTRKFSNFFFEGKEKIIKKLDFFLHNKDWYFNTGVPYSIGFGMYGPPGTGKTSLIKAIAHHTGRHIISISLKLIKTKKQLDTVFFEERYNTDNKKSSMGFDKKIIVFEDIDCIGDIVLDRKKKDKQTNNVCSGKQNQIDFNKITSSSNINIGDLLESISTSSNSDQIQIQTAKMNSKTLLEDEPLTLDDILNLWDGIRETPGRIMIISSNHYYDLDPALIRPGRIDVTLELSFASHNTISEMYKHLFESDIDETSLHQIQNNFYSPAEIMNIYMNEDRDSVKFIKRLQKNCHI